MVQPARRLLNWPVLEKKATDEASALQAFARSYANIAAIMGEETTDEIELNMAGLAMFPREWAGVFAADETPPKRAFMIKYAIATAGCVRHCLRNSRDNQHKCVMSNNRSNFVKCST